MARRKSKLQQITEYIYSANLTRDEMEELKVIAQGLIDSYPDEDEAPEEKSPEKITRDNWQECLGKRGVQGYIETKRIPSGKKGTRTYLYLRYWQGKKLKSIYLGKPEEL